MKKITLIIVLFLSINLFVPAEQGVNKNNMETPKNTTYTITCYPQNETYWTGYVFYDTENITYHKNCFADNRI